jgi:hypothetical protein
MTIRAPKSVGDFPFGASRAALTAVGRPVREGVNRIGLHEVEFGEIIYRFEDDAFVEASFPLPSSLTIDDRQVEGASLIAFLRKHDPSFREVHGFGVAHLRFGCRFGR